MSHFVVMVTNTNLETPEEQLEPFYEQGDEDDYFMEKEYFLRRDEKEVEEWLDNELKEKTELREKSSHPDNMAYVEYLEKSIKELNRIKRLKNLDRKLHAIKNINGCGIDRGGLYWVYNPNARWDWWVEGGRWDGWLVKKSGQECNRCLVKEVDFDRMRKAELKSRAKYYDEETKKAKEEGREPFFWGYKQTPTRDEYVYGGKIVTSPYAVLHNGEWIEKGEMDWWGVDNPKYEEEDWDKKFQEFFKTLDPESEITIVDCHI